VVEQVGNVLPHPLVGCEQAEVLVQPRRGRMVVAGADAAVAPERAVGLLADDEHELRVRLHAHEPVDDVAARLLQLPRPGDVRPLVLSEVSEALTGALRLRMTASAAVTPNATAMAASPS